MERRDVLKLGVGAAALVAAAPAVAAIAPAAVDSGLHGDRISIPGVPNKNGRIYPRSVWEKVIELERERIATRRLLVHSWAAPGIRPDGFENSLESVVGVVTGLLVGWTTWVTWETLQTPMGLNWAPLIAAGKYDIRASGRGTVRDGVVQDDYRIERLVIMPAGMGA